MKCVKCGCTEEKPCEGGCSWLSKDPAICSRCVPVLKESIGAALIDSARISIMAAMQAFPPPAESVIVAVDANDQPDPTLFDCLAMAMEWLDAGRALSVQKGAPATSLHVVPR